MFHHIGLRSQHPDALIAFYEAALQPLGYSKLAAYGGGAGFGEGDRASFWIDAASLWVGTSLETSSVHLAFSCRDRRYVDAFFEAAIAAGGKHNGAPGLRSQYHPSYYAAFVIDPDGNNIEAVCCEERND